jgi:hypothetical protein
MQSDAPKQLNRPTELPVRIYSVVVAVLPVLASYASGIPGFSVADVALALCAVMAVLGGYSKRNDFVVKPTMIMIAMYLIVLLSLVSMLTQSKPEMGNVLIRTIRYFFYLAVIAICSVRMLDLSYCKRLVKIVAILGAAYIMLQYLLYGLFGFVLRGFLPFLNLYVEDYALRDYESVYSLTMYRPTSFFLEPAHFARYAVVGVTLFLFDDKKLTAKNVMAAVFISVGILLSTSAQGYLLMALVWLICLLRRIKDAESSGLKGLLICVILLLPVLLVLLMQIPIIQSAVTRALNIDITSKNTALGARLGGINSFLELPFGYKLIGMGFGVVPERVWLSSAVYWLYGSGVFVFAIYVIYAGICLKKTRGVERYILLIFMVLFISDDSFYSYMCVLFITLSLLRPVEGRR